MAEVERLTVFFMFRGNLQELLPPRWRGVAFFAQRLDRRASIKDVVESLRVPHPEVQRLLVNGEEVGFDYLVRPQDRIEVYPLTPPDNVLVATRLRPVPLPACRFVVDVNVGRLAILLRLLGFDAVYENNLLNGDLASISQRGERILLTRDTNLLKRKIVVYGHLIRALQPEAQVVEVVRLYALADRMQWLSRCLRCNGSLVPVAKEKIMARLEPLTKKYYDSFRICDRCRQIYWPGSHQENMTRYLHRLAALIRAGA